jgi:hypothetical protein
MPNVPSLDQQPNQGIAKDRFMGGAENVISIDQWKTCNGIMKQWAIRSIDQQTSSAPKLRISSTADRASDMAPPAKRPLPDHLYVDIPTVTSTMSKLVLLVCMFSLAMSFLADVDMIHPFAAIIISIGCICFYIMSRMVVNKYSGNVR